MNIIKFFKKIFNKTTILSTISLLLSVLMLPSCGKNKNEETTTADKIKTSIETTYEPRNTTDNIIEIITPVETTNVIEIAEPIITTQDIKDNLKIIIPDDNFGNKIEVNHEEFEISEELLNKIKKHIKSYPNKSAFYVVTLDGKLSFGYNINEQFQAASSVKAPFVLYCLKEIEKGNASLDEIKTYEQKHYEEKSGLIKKSKFGTEYTLKEIIYYTIHESDNAGFYMLHDRFSKSGYNEMLKELGCSKMQLANYMKFGMVTPKEMLTVWNEIYNYSQENELGAYYLDLLKNAKYNFIKEGLIETLGADCEIAHKSGFNAKGRHDVAIVFDEIPYYITVMTDYPGENSNSEYINTMAKLLNEVINEYKLYLNNVKTLTKK